MNTESTTAGAWRVSVRQGGFAAATALLLTGLFFAWQSVSMSFGDFGVPGPGFFPFALGIALCVIAVAILIETARAPDAAAPPVELGHRDVVVVFAALVGVTLGFERLGAYVSLGLFMAALLVVVAHVHWTRALLAAVVTAVAVWLVFKLALGVQLPAGPF
jgi:putative tricarboxylic transport membrane protein